MAARHSNLAAGVSSVNTSNLHGNNLSLYEATPIAFSVKLTSQDGNSARRSSYRLGGPSVVARMSASSITKPIRSGRARFSSAAPGSGHSGHRREHPQSGQDCKERVPPRSAVTRHQELRRDLDSQLAHLHESGDVPCLHLGFPTESTGSRAGAPSDPFGLSVHGRRDERIPPATVVSGTGTHPRNSRTVVIVGLCRERGTRSPINSLLSPAL